MPSAAQSLSPERASVPETLFVVAGDRYVPTDATLGPWGAGLLHGGPVSALCALLLEDLADPSYWSVRFSIDLMRPITQDPLRVTPRVVRTGKRLQLLEGEVHCGDKLAAHCSLLRLRPRTTELPPDTVTLGAPPSDRPESFPLSLATPNLGPNEVYFFGAGIECHAPGEGPFQAGLGWFRVRLPVVAGREASPMGRVAAAADFSNGISGFGGGPFEKSVAFPNADLQVNVLRPLEGEWVRIAAQSLWTADGIGMASSELADTEGVIGVAHQNLALDSRLPAT